MILITVHPVQSGTGNYGPASEKRSTSDLGQAMKLFSGSGEPGMAFQYVVTDQDSGEPLVTYYADQGDLAQHLPVA
jgi:hypothetical protein